MIDHHKDPKNNMRFSKLDDQKNLKIIFKERRKGGPLSPVSINRAATELKLIKQDSALNIVSCLPTQFRFPSSTQIYPRYQNMDKVQKLSSENGVVIFSKKGKEIEKALLRMGFNGPVPAVFISGKLVGSTNEVMSLHLSGSLIPQLQPYQASN
ncbi:unnamed protein product [Fraxinus pennsylvanica]|uniref:Glutaredoxin domain-containing protein n=1 Tax=Fraxinus pennsylvanica TaxID=56036 RepID=A0AAD1ZFB0_9LAMI|nr:unnamed protein product [Fraxinus pennsylvanica]